MRSLSTIVTSPTSTSRHKRAVSELCVSIAIASASIVFMAYAVLALLDYSSDQSAAHAIAGFAIVILALPFLVLSGMLLHAFMKWVGLDVKAAAGFNNKGS